jgi:hypothetical protein
MTRFIGTVFGCIALAGCVQPLEEYRPVTDPAAPNAARYERDLQACYAVAKAAEADYQKRQEEQMAQNMVAGILIGAIAGAAVGNSDTAGVGAAYGAGAGAAATDTELAIGGPRRIIDRCMTERGHKVLSDLGRG